MKLRKALDKAKKNRQGEGRPGARAVAAGRCRKIAQQGLVAAAGGKDDAAAAAAIENSGYKKKLKALETELRVLRKSFEEQLQGFAKRVRKLARMEIKNEALRRLLHRYVR